jgi:hypothetical protein
MKSNKAPGIDGVAPGLLKILNDEWIFIITYIFNVVFSYHYPLMWTIAKVFNIFKKGDNLDPSNYRGISIMTALAKLYDSVLNERFMLWYKPKEEQAGGQSGRGCAEQIMVLRLLIDIARKKKRTLFVTFIDYQKAYDRVHRLKLLKFLDRKGCGSTFVENVRKTYAMTIGKIGTSQFEAKSGVRQGSSTSCSLFTFFIEPTIDAIRRDGDDDWLGSLHSLLLMDDTVVFATSWQKMLKKLENLNECIQDIGMVINASKSKFLCVNPDILNSFDLNGIVIEHTDQYCYLGSIITVSSIAEQVKCHLSSKSGQLLKFYSFLRKNSEAPYAVKQRVWDSALCNSVFYGCESWFTKDLRDAETLYNAGLKSLLGVRVTTCNDLMCVEAGEPGAKGYILQRQYNFLRSLRARDSFSVSYLHRVVQEAIQCRTPGGCAIEVVEACNTPPSAAELDRKRTSVSESVSSRRLAYKSLNPELSIHSVYSLRVPEMSRLSFTRVRLSSHRMRFETGRWARIPAEERLCDCGQVQNENHVLLVCRLTRPLRERFAVQASCFRELFNPEINAPENVCKYCHELLKIFQ